ncbi:hypothetical protein DNTS_003418 [Danionella cerebrum]|uniref:Uncharacterized protein n=1 Tax=Danionella cerebrum TaxID=2873325 RepID=A0A553PR90_9TELE|nr:hypothetical protein DNTS_003418 [Danionella translucida]
MGQVYPKFSVEAQSVCIVYPLPQVTAEDVDIRLFREKECVIFFKKNRLIHGCEGSSKWSHTTEQGSVTFFLNNVTFLEHGDYLSQVRLSPGDNPIEVTKIFHALQQSENEFKRKRVPAKTEPMEHRESGASDAVNVHLISNGKIFGFENQFLLNLRSRIEDLKVTQDVEDSNIVVIFCPVVSRAGTDIDAALAQIKYPPENKLTVLAMLHHTFEPEKTLANSNYYVQQKNILAVDFLFHEDKGLLDCQKNTNATDKTVNWLIEQAHKIGITLSDFVIFGSEKQIIHNLLSRIEDLKVTQDVEDSNIVVIFCPVVSRAGTDIDAALAQIKYPPENKLTVLAVLHHTFDPEKTLADSNNYVQQKNILAVDFLFYEDKGLLDCQKNSNATDKTVNWLIEQAHETGITLHRKSKSPSN